MSRENRESILIIDSDRDFAQGLILLLELEGYAVIATQNCDQARAHLCQHSVDIVIMDAGPMTGEAIAHCEELRRYGPRIGIILTSTQAALQDRYFERLQALEVCGLLIKPFPPEELFQIVRECPYESLA